MVDIAWKKRDAVDQSLAVLARRQNPTEGPPRTNVYFGPYVLRFLIENHLSGDIDILCHSKLYQL